MHVCLWILSFILPCIYPDGSGEDTDRPDTADLEVRKIQDGNEAEDMAYGDISQRDTDRSRLEQ